MNPVPVCTTLLLAFLSAAPRTAEKPDILPAARQDFVFQAQEGSRPSMYEFLEQYQRVAGVHVIVSMKIQLQPLDLELGPTKSIEIPRQSVQERVEGILAGAGYCMTLVHADDPVLVAVKRMPRSPLKDGAVFVEPDQLASVANHPALLCWTVLDLPIVATHNLDADLVRQWYDDKSNTHLSLGGSGKRVLMGAGKTVAERARVLLDLEAAESAKAEAAAKPEGGSKK